MSKPEQFYDLLFEFSNENRHRILLLLEEQAMRTIELARGTGLNNPEIRRHISRLVEINLIQRNSDGFYSLTPYGKASLSLFQEIEFVSKNNKYFKNHSLARLPNSMFKQIGKLMNASIISNPMDFIRHTQNIMKEAENKVLMLVDQFPMYLLPNIIDTVDRGLKIKIIESSKQAFIPDMSALTSEESKALIRTKNTSLIEQRRISDVPFQMFYSDTCCLLCFPVSSTEYDYTGFLCIDNDSLEWSSDLFDHYWNKAIPGITEQSEVSINRGIRHELGGSITVEGLNDPKVDAQAVQDAVDHYDEVVLKGKFNFGATGVVVSKSVSIRGDGRENDIPQTLLYKQGWSFPFHRFTAIIELDADDIDVTIENIHFTDFNCAAIYTTGRLGPKGVSRINSVRIVKNRITVNNGFGRGVKFGAFGDLLHGIAVEEIGDGGVVIEDNYIDLAIGGMHRGVLGRGGIENDPEYRPNLLNHEYFIGNGISVNGSFGDVLIQNNIIKNANGRGIASTGNKKSKVMIKDNIILSEVYGSYPFSSRESGAGILAQTGLGLKDNPGFYLRIENNSIELEKLNHSGIIVLGPTVEGVSKLHDGVIRGNKIHLKNGYEGIHVRKCDLFQVIDNKITGETYYGVRVSGSRRYGNLDMSSIGNQISENDLKELIIKVQDEYVLNHLDGKMFTKGEPKTAHYWLDKYTEKNQVSLNKNESIIDESENNIITYQ